MVYTPRWHLWEHRSDVIAPSRKFVCEVRQSDLSPVKYVVLVEKSKTAIQSDIGKHV